MRWQQTTMPDENPFLKYKVRNDNTFTDLNRISSDVVHI